MSGKSVLVILIFICFGIGGFSQSLFESATSNPDPDKKFAIEFNGYGRGSGYGGSKLYDYSSIFAEFAIQGKLSVKRAYLFTDLRFRVGVEFDSMSLQLQMRETYAGYQSDKLDVYLGAKIVTWGRMDGFNPTDNITPYDYFFLSPNPDDQKLSNFLLQARWYITPKINFELITIPVYRPSVYRYDLFDLGEYTSFTTPALPPKTFKNGSLAARLNFNFAKIGWSVSYFRGYDPFYGFNVNNISWDGFVPSIILAAQPYYKNTFGADFDLVLGSWIIRGEAAFDLTKEYEDNMYIPNPGIAYVAGVEHNFFGIVTNLQFIGHYAFDFVSLDDLPPPSGLDEMINRELTAFNRKIFYQQEQFNHAFSLSLSKSLAYQTLMPEAMGYYNITSEEWFVRLSVKWNITDYLQTSIGGFYSAGPDKSIYYYASDVLNGAFIELKVSF